LNKLILCGKVPPLLIKFLDIMSETNMPAAEVNSADEKNFISYEFAFHVLPTVAEGEVPNVVEVLKAHITKAGGEIFDEEVAQRFDLAYEITKYLEGKNRRFNSAYFGWVRFRLDPAELAELTEHLDASKEILRYLLVKLTKVEEAHPFRFHESIVDRKVRTISEDEMAEIEEEAAAETEAGEVDDVSTEEIEEVEVDEDGKEGEEKV
jgi:ribosomal protein S6